MPTRLKARSPSQQGDTDCWVVNERVAGALKIMLDNPEFLRGEQKGLIKPMTIEMARKIALEFIAVWHKRDEVSAEGDFLYHDRISRLKKRHSGAIGINGKIIGFSIDGLYAVLDLESDDKTISAVRMKKEMRGGLKVKLVSCEPLLSLE